MAFDVEQLGALVGQFSADKVDNVVPDLKKTNLFLLKSRLRHTLVHVSNFDVTHTL